MTGEADGPPVLSSVPIGDYMGAFFGVSGVLAALYWRDARGGHRPARRREHLRSGAAVPRPRDGGVVTGRAGADAHGQPHPGRDAAQRLPHARRALDRDLGTDRRAGPPHPRAHGRRHRRHRARSSARATERNANADELDGMVAAWVATMDAAARRRRARRRAHPGHRGERRREPARRRARAGARRASWSSTTPSSAPCTCPRPRRGSAAPRPHRVTGPRSAPTTTTSCATGWAD